MKLLAEWKPLDDIQRGFVESNATLPLYTGGVACGKTGAALMKTLLLGTVVQHPGADSVPADEVAIQAVIGRFFLDFPRGQVNEQELPHISVRHNPLLSAPAWIRLFSAYDITKIRLIIA